MSINYEMIPEHCRGGLERYIEHGIKPGDFLTAVLENNFCLGVARADDINSERLRDYVHFLHCEAPSDCSGSPEAVKAWIACGGLKGKRDHVEKT